MKVFVVRIADGFAIVYRNQSTYCIKIVLDGKIKMQIFRNTNVEYAVVSNAMNENIEKKQIEITIFIAEEEITHDISFRQPVETVITIINNQRIFL